MNLRASFPWLVLALTMLAGKPVHAQAAITIDYDTQAFQSRKLQAGAVEVSVNYEPYKQTQDSPENSDNLHYQISYNGQVKVKAGVSTVNSGEVSLKDLDGDRIAEVIVSSFSGGAHCCTNIKIYAWQKDHFGETETGFLDGMGGTFQDLDRDGKQELVTVDNAFLYTFSSYAGSFPPTLIYAFQQGQLQDVTRHYPKYLRTQLQAMFKTFQETRNQGERNGVLAGYVAQKALLGEFQQGWDFMLANYDRSSDWGLTRYDSQGQETGRYPDFPAALKALLIKRGYLDDKGHPR